MPRESISVPARWPIADGVKGEMAIATAAVVLGVLLVGFSPGLGSTLVLLLAAGLLALFLFFFRDPERAIPLQPDAVLSPADGKVLEVETTEEPEFLHGAARRVCVFLSLFDVHVNRAPMGGLVELVRHVPGKYHRAYLSQASHENERNVIGLANGDTRLLVRQIAGIVARRVVCRLKPGDKVEAGLRFGLIKFGSRVEVYLPLSYEVCVGVGDRVVGGVSVIARRQPVAGERHVVIGRVEGA